jgi:hypothetical protein
MTLPADRATMPITNNVIPATKVIIPNGTAQHPLFLAYQTPHPMSDENKTIAPIIKTGRA